MEALLLIILIKRNTNDIKFIVLFCLHSNNGVFIYLANQQYKNAKFELFQCIFTFRYSYHKKIIKMSQPVI